MTQSRGDGKGGRRVCGGDGRGGELVAARAIHALLEGARGAGVDVDALRALAPPVSGHDDELVPVARLLACSRALMAVAHEDIGLAIGQRIPLEGTGLWGFLLRSSATFGEMLDRGARYVRIVDAFPEFELRRRGACVALVSSHPRESPLGPRHHVVTATMSRWIAWGRQLSGVQFPVLEARIGGPVPADTGPWRRFFGGRVTFGTAEDSYLVDADVLELPLRDSAPELSEDLERLAKRQLARLGDTHALLDRVEQALEEESADGLAGIERIADRLSMTPRTLQRRLAGEGTTFRRLRERLLRVRAENLLRGSDATLEEVSFRLGYADPPNFSRAFRRWTGVAPGTWRAGRRPVRIPAAAMAAPGAWPCDSGGRRVSPCIRRARSASASAGPARAVDGATTACARAGCHRRAEHR